MRSIRPGDFVDRLSKAQIALDRAVRSRDEWKARAETAEHKLREIEAGPSNAQTQGAVARPCGGCGKLPTEFPAHEVWCDPD